MSFLLGIVLTHTWMLQSTLKVTLTFFTSAAEILENEELH